MPSGSEAGDNQFDKKSKQSAMMDRNHGGNASESGTNAMFPDRKPPRYNTQSRFKEIFGPDDVEPKAKPVDRNVRAPPLSVTKSNAPSTASTYSEYEKPMQPVSQKSSGNDKLKVSVLPPTSPKKEIIEKKAEGVSQEMTSAGANLENQEDGGVAVVHDDESVKITGVEKDSWSMKGITNWVAGSFRVVKRSPDNFWIR